MVPTLSNRSMGSVLCAGAVVVLDGRRWGTHAAAGAGRVMGVEGKRRGAGGLGRRGTPGQMGARPLRETPPKGRHLVGTPPGIGKASGENCSAAASSLIRWGGCAAMLGGLSTAFAGGFFPSYQSKSKGE